MKNGSKYDDDDDDDDDDDNDDDEDDDDDAVHMVKYILCMAPPSSDPGALVTQPNIWTQRHKR